MKQNLFIEFQLNRFLAEHKKLKKKKKRNKNPYLSAESSSEPANYNELF